MIRKILNGDQNAKNTLKLNAGESGCCGDMADVCRYTAAYAKSGAVTDITIEENGKNKTLPCVIAANSTAAVVKAAILTSLDSAGYENSLQEDSFEGVVIVTGATNQNVVVTGNAKLISITHAGGTATATAACDVEHVCTFTNQVGYGGGADATQAVNLRINGKDNNLGAITAGTTTPAQVQTAVTAALTASGVGGTATVTALGTGAGTTYSISITGVKVGTTISLGGYLFSKNGCGVTFL